jgi:hypothetical protein
LEDYIDLDMLEKQCIMKSAHSTTAVVLKNIARYVLLVLGMLTFLFALVSGSESFGGGVMGILKNSPNALPWLILLLLLWLAWKRELIGGLLLMSLGIGLFFFFYSSGGTFYWIPFALTLLIVVLGVFFVISWMLEHPRPQT